MHGLNFVDGLLDAIQPVCQVIQLMEPLLLVKDVVKKVLVAWVGICRWIDGCYTNRLPGRPAGRVTIAGVFASTLAGKGCGKEGAIVAWVGICGWIA